MRFLESAGASVNVCEYASHDGPGLDPKIGSVGFRHFLIVIAKDCSRGRSTFE